MRGAGITSDQEGGLEGERRNRLRAAELRDHETLERKSWKKPEVPRFFFQLSYKYGKSRVHSMTLYWGWVTGFNCNQARLPCIRPKQATMKALSLTKI